MPRSFLADQLPTIINSVSRQSQKPSKTLQIATGNKRKLKELQDLLPEYTLEAVDLKMDEIQDLSPEVVAEKKAIQAFEKNGNNPILVEDTALEIAGLGNRPGTLVTFFTTDPTMRKEIAEKWLESRDRRARAIVTLAIYDGLETYTFQGVTAGTISDTLKGNDEFGWNDMFIPTGSKKTFAEMKWEERAKYSMRTKAVQKFRAEYNDLHRGVLELPEPFNSELGRLETDKLNSPKAVKFAYLTEATAGNKPNTKFSASTYLPLREERNPYYLRYKLEEDSASIGLVLTDVDRANNGRYKNGEPILWQMGPERRKLALAQRAQFFIANTNKTTLNTLVALENATIPHRSNKESNTIRTMLYDNSMSNSPIYARAVKELGYKKITATKDVSRSAISETGLFNKIGKYPRSMLAIGSMPAVSGWKDVIVTAALGHMPIFIARNNIFAENTDLRLKLIEQAKNDILSLKLGKKLEHRVLRNLGVAIGTSDPKWEVKNAIKFYEKAGIKLFRIYTINGDPRCIETAELLRKELGNDIEIFAGQITERKQAKEYIDRANVDAIIFGHGGGRQCTSAINGMAISTVEEMYSLVTDRYFNNTTLLIEGGVGRNLGPLMLLGIDGIIYNQQLTRGTLEIGGIFIENKAGEYGQPYHGSASAPTMIIEAANPKLKHLRINPSGRTKVPEGKPGFSFYSEKANSMVFWIDEFKHHMARTMADLGVSNIIELRELLLNNDKDLLRIVTPEAARTAQPYGTFR